MKVGEKVVYFDDNDIERICEIFKVNTYKNPKTGDDCYSYDILYPERNVPFESIFTVEGKQIKKGDIVYYQKKDIYFEAIVSTIDWSSSSAQLRIIKRNIN